MGQAHISPCEYDNVKQEQNIITIEYDNDNDKQEQNIITIEYDNDNEGAEYHHN